ncbi:DUF1778 domain-containing protein [Bordetella bronchiseptica]|uniref:type II toxin-antitoxin system TacA family antitoxin n=1 Tax=Bordetella bronchiseptica TaxID=518 RepID=UPI0004A13E3A|nr:DUF1778 domain-containing protein [Bordetella bronchiseptica]KDC75188.1 PF08681 family protein [Bordetella bronchiseptica MBORD632]
MSGTAEVKDERLQVRLNAEAKTMLQRAASYRHKTVSQFVLTTALAEAEKVIRENEAVSLSAADWKVFYDALNAPPAPNAALRKAFAKYQKAAG